MSILEILFLAERTLFAEDMIMYFMKKLRVQWTPVTLGKFLVGNRRRFTEAIGSVAWHLAHSNIEESFNIESPFLTPWNYLPMDYNPEDFLHYCGLMAWSLEWHCRNGEYKFADEVVLAISTYLGVSGTKGSFSASGGWNALAKYADETLKEIKDRSLAERILFAEDLVMYFMTRTQVEWTPGTNGRVWYGHRRWFTEAIGSAAWWLATILSTQNIIFSRENRPKVPKGYHPNDFLQYCGAMAWSSVLRFVGGDYQFPDVVVLDITAYLGKLNQDDLFSSLGGWCGLNTYARSLQNALLEAQFVYRTAQNRQIMQQADYGDVTQMEKQCIGSLLQDL